MAALSIEQIMTCIPPVVVKARLGDEIRRVRFDRLDSYSNLVKHLTELFRSRTGVAFQLGVKYEDYEGDSVSISSDAELGEALRLAAQFSNSILRLNLTIVGPKHTSIDESLSELKEIARDSLRAGDEFVHEMGAVVQQFAKNVQEAVVTKLNHIEQTCASAPSSDLPSAITVSTSETAAAVAEPLPIVSLPVTPLPVVSIPVVVPVVVPATPPVVYDAQFLEDVTIGQGTEVVIGTTFRKMWRVRNTGATAWPSDCRLVHVRDHTFAAQEITVAAQPGEEVVLTLALTSPAAEGPHSGVWSLSSAANTFGPELSVSIVCVLPVEPVPMRRSLMGASFSSSPVVPTELSVSSTTAAAAAAAVSGASITDGDEWVVLSPREQADQPASPPSVAQPLASEPVASEPIREPIAVDTIVESAVSDEAASQPVVSEPLIKPSEPLMLAQEVTTQSSPYADKLTVLHEMGFHDDRRNLRLLEAAHGDVEETLDALMAL
eukprot:TRINITY_DN4011_c1_g1_i1.p1 TRINITY_DN4011_c1_g1~~TRINITY_DN4011_c1_g1_i1.p1  ORF type:complete len:512 (+),score=125.05 TRINITY_DN4011_c1_g1_i1:61-1536(+)